MVRSNWLKYLYPNISLDVVNRSVIEYKTGLILLLDILCFLCTVMYSFTLKSYCSSGNVLLSVYFILLPVGMKLIGRWNLFGMAVCIGWLVDNILVARCSLNQAIPLSFFQSLIPSYFILSSEMYIFGGIFVTFQLTFSLPYQYAGVYEALGELDNEEFRIVVLELIKETELFNLLHMLAVFGLTMWLQSCSNHEFKFMNKLLLETKQAKQAAEMFFAAFSHEFRNPLNS